MSRDARDPTDFKPAEYWLGCRERFGEAENYLRAGRHGPALTLSGVAAECALRSMLPEGAPFAARHDMYDLLRAMEDRPTQPLVAAAQTLRVLWRNNYRYMGEDQQARVIESTKRYPNLQRAHGLVEAAKDAIDAARTIVTHARVTKWKSRSI